tara:strand:- start:63 stop:479 length:417 start_codon:yes stop_codon:yes gene_type:complete
MELCDSANVIEKLNQEFDDLQNLNQELVEEIELKAETIKEQQVELKIMSLWIQYKKIDSFTEQIHFWYDNGEYIQNKLGVDIDYNPEYDKVFCEWYPTTDTDGFEDLWRNIPNLLQRRCEVYEDNFEDYIMNELIEDY